jgi:class 3 adenylate cyclase
VGSTRLYEVLGDLKARDMVVACVDIMRAATERNRGSVIKTIGDEILAIFPTADDAVNAAQVQQDIGARPSLSVQGQRVTIASAATSGRSCSRSGMPARPCAREPHDEPGQGGADHPHCRDGLAPVAGMARSDAADRRHAPARTRGRDRALRGALAAGGRDQHAAVDRRRRTHRPPPDARRLRFSREMVLGDPRA